MALEWVFGGEDVAPGPQPVSRPGDRKAVPTPAPQPAVSSLARTGEDPDYSIYPPWNKTNEETRTLFLELKTLVESLGRVRTDAFKSEMSFKCLPAPGNSEPVVAYVKMRIHDGLRVRVYETHVRHIQPEDGFTRHHHSGKLREIIIREEKEIQRAEPLLRAAYDNLAKQGDSPARSVAARKAWETRRSQ